ncbi:MAG: hypothetical protein ABI091_01080 [Ferruginibacter sp.]
MKTIFPAFIGALIALMLSTFFSRVNNAIRLNRIRRSIILYLQLIGRNKLERYIQDAHKAIIFLKNVELANQDKSDGFDEMPILTSELLKSYSQTDLLIVCYSTRTYSALLDFSYCVDYLKKNMPRDVYDKFSEWTNKHLETKNIPVGNEQFKHIKTCQSIDRERKTSIRNIEMTISTAKGVKENINSMLKKLKGHNIHWIWKYIRKL